MFLLMSLFKKYVLFFYNNLVILLFYFICVIFLILILVQDFKSKNYAFNFLFYFIFKKNQYAETSSNFFI